MKTFIKIAAVLMAIVMLAGFAAGCASKNASSGEETTAAEDTSVKAPSSFDEKCLDEYGTPTLYAITQLTGPELVTLLEEQGYEWERKDDTLKRFIRRITLPGETIGQDVTFDASNKMFADIWEREDYDNAVEKGSVASMQTNFIVAGYGDPTGEKNVVFDDMINAIINIEIVDQYFYEELDAVMLIVKDSSGKEYAVSAQAVGPARTDIEVFTDELLATCDPPSSIAQEWMAFTGQESYGQ